MSTFFEGHNLYVQNKDLIPLQIENETITYLVILLALSVYAFIINLKYSSIIEGFKNVFSVSYMTNVSKFAKPLYFSLLTVFHIILVYGLIVRGLIPDTYMSYKLEQTPLNLMTYTVLFTLSVQFAVYLLLKLVSFVFDEKEFIKVYILSESVALVYVSCLLLPILAASFVFEGFIGQNIILIILIIYLLAVIFGLFKTIKIGYKSSKFSILHIFLYLCTLKIAPIIGLWKLFFVETLLK